MKMFGPLKFSSVRKKYKNIKLREINVWPPLLFLAVMAGMAIYHFCCE